MRATAIISAPITTDKVASTIGASTHSVAKLCQASSLINARSARKPMRYAPNGGADNVYRALEDSQYRIINYGTKINAYTDINLAISALDLAISGDAKPTDMAYYYDAPVDGDVCRLTDFEGYNPTPIDWLTINITNNGSSSATAVQNYTHLNVQFNEPLGSFQSLQSWGFFQRYYSALRFALLIKGANGTFLMPLLSGEDFTQYSGGDISFKPSISGEYKIYPILTTMRVGNDGAIMPIQSVPKGDTSQLYIPMPYASYTTWKPVASGTPEGGLPPTAETVDIRMVNHATQHLGDGWYIVNQFTLFCESNGKDVEIVVYAGTDDLDKVYLGSWLVADDFVDYIRDEKVEESELRFRSEDYQPKLRVYFQKANATESRKIFDLT